MLDPILIFVGVVFALAGFAKGAIGLGLPTISMGLLAVVMPPDYGRCCSPFALGPAPAWA
jgi:hypothetical protein